MASDTPNPRFKQVADLLDVHILDMAAEIEALLRGVREVQRGVLRARGVTLPGGEQPAVYIQQRLEGMLKECGTLRDAVLQAMETAKGLSPPEEAV